MNMKTTLEKIQELFFKQLNLKHEWAAEEVKKLYQETVINVLLDGKL